MSEIIVRAAAPTDAPQMARVHVQSWQETYRGLAPDKMLDDPDFVERRERMWSHVLGDTENDWRVAVAELDGRVIGIAFAGPNDDDEDSTPDWKLNLLYLLAAHQGRGAGQRLLDAVIGDRAAVLRVADPNPRAQAFYRRNGFLPDGTCEPFGTGREIRMVREAR